VLNFAIGLFGAGGYQAQCGLVEGTLMFIGILGKTKIIRITKLKKSVILLQSNLKRNLGA